MIVHAAVVAVRHGEQGLVGRWMRSIDLRAFRSSDILDCDYRRNHAEDRVIMLSQRNRMLRSHCGKAIRWECYNGE
jgi:hypothetical protein